MNCPKCNQPIDDQCRFCQHCGGPVSRQTSEPEPAERLGLAPAERDPGGEDVYHDPEQERQVWEGRPAWRSQYGIWAAWALGSAMLLGAAIKWKASDSIAVELTLLLVLGTGIAILVREALFVFGFRYRLTTQRLFVHRGILTRVTDQMELIRVNDVRLRQGVVDRLVNTGDVEIMSTDETDETVTLQSIGAPAEAAEAVRLHVRQSRKKNTLLVEKI